MTFDTSILKTGPDFERFCLALFQRSLNDPGAELVATNGVSQDGVDILACRNGDPTCPIGIQCKLKAGRNRLSPREVEDEIEKALQFNPLLVEYIVATTSKNDRKLQELAARISAQQWNAGRRIRIRVCGWDTLSELIKRYPEVKDVFYPPAGPTISGVLEAYRLRLTKEVMSFRWWRNPIPITLENAQHEVAPARMILSAWYQSNRHQHCAIVGDPGSGKTGVIWWLASELVKRDVIVLNISALRLAKLTNISFTALAEITEPRFAIEQFDPSERQVFLLLDGLDELAGAGSGGHTLATEKVADVLATLPINTRVVVSCRPQAFALLRGTLERTLPSSSPNHHPRDPYANATEWAARGEKDNTLLLSVRAVQRQDALRYLGEHVGEAFGAPKYARFLTGPFTLQLVKTTHAQLDDSGPITLDQLYRTYIRAALRRDQPTLGVDDCEVLVQELADLACVKFRGRGRDRGRGLRRPMGSSIRSAIQANLIYEDRGDIEFMHYSLWEFFFAEKLARQIRDFDADILSEVDMVRGDNLNRMLVPMLNRSHERMPDRGLARATPAKEYKRFMKTTGWRRATGYGMHPSIGSGAATFSFTPDQQIAIHEDNFFGEALASSISWYDAAAFALWSRSRLPTQQEARTLKGTGDFYFWCADWFDEDSSHMAVFDARNDGFQGLNPDIRLASTALATV